MRLGSRKLRLTSGAEADLLNFKLFSEQRSDFGLSTPEVFPRAASVAVSRSWRWQMILVFSLPTPWAKLRPEYAFRAETAVSEEPNRCQDRSHASAEPFPTA